MYIDHEQTSAQFFYIVLINLVLDCSRWCHWKLCDTEYIEKERHFSAQHEFNMHAIETREGARC
jgi:hypothetical protein